MPTPLFKIFLLALIGLSAQAANLSGAGSTFAEPLYRKWAEQYQKQAGAGSVVNYEAVGSGEGVKRIATKQVDFGASDEPLKRAELDEKGLRQFPVAMGAVVPVVNLPGVQAGSLKLNADVLAKSYTGRIKRWNDTEILALNEGIPANALDRAIKPVYRADSSGSTFAFSYYLNARSPDWKKSQGVSKELKGVSGTAAKGSGAVVEAVKTTPGAIAYAEYGRALRDKLNMVQLPNRVGVYVKASPEAILAAAQFDTEKLLYSADPDFYLVLVDNDTYAGWPMATLTFTLVPKSGPGAQKVLEFIYWGYKHGDGASRELGYVPLSDSMKIGVRKAWSRQYGYKAGL